MFLSRDVKDFDLNLNKSVFLQRAALSSEGSKDLLSSSVK